MPDKTPDYKREQVIKAVTFQAPDLNCRPRMTQLVSRHEQDTSKALSFARRLVQSDAFNVEAHLTLLRLLLAEGFASEAQQRFEHAARQFRQVSAPDLDTLERSYKALRSRGRESGPGPVRRSQIAGATRCSE